MLSFFPTPYKDELLYSVIARYHIRSGNISYRHTINDLIGTNEKKKMSVYFPTGVNRIAEQLQFNNNYNPEIIVSNHTLYRFYTAFLPNDISEKILYKMLSGDSTGVIATLGICSSKISIPQYFRFCPECAKEELQKYGEMYWHRSHQAPCVLVCTRHKVLLQNSDVKLSNNIENQYIHANEANCNLNNKNNNISEDLMYKLYKLSQNVEYLLNNDLKNRNQQWFINNYKNYLIKNGIATYNGNVRQVKLEREFKLFYGSEFLRLVESDIDYKTNRNNWLSDITRNTRDHIHPIRHLLFIEFLGVEIESIFRQQYTYKPFGDGPWPCLNSICPNYKNEIIKNVDIKFDSGRNKIRGIFSCECGFVYSRDSRNKDKYTISKVLNFGSLWENKLIELVTRKRFSLQELAEILNVAWNTVDLHAERLNLDTYWRRDRNKIRYANDIKDKQNDIDIKKLTHYRKVWLNIRNENPNKYREELKKINPAVYSWLYDNDKSWLNKNMPEVRNSINNRRIINWDDRDEKTLEGVKRSVKNILDLDKKPVKITKSQIIKDMKVSKNLFIKLYKLPKTEKYLNNILEDQEDFIKRKIKWGIKTLEREGELISKNKVMKKITLGKKYRKLARKILEQELDSYSKKV